METFETARSDGDGGTATARTGRRRGRSPGRRVTQALGHALSAPAQHQGRRRLGGGRHAEEGVPAADVQAASAGRQEAGRRLALSTGARRAT